MAYMESGATPCIDCGTTGGKVPRDCVNPVRKRGRCVRCYELARYHGTVPATHRACLSCGEERLIRTHGLCHRCGSRAVKQGILSRWPACGAVPVPYVVRDIPEHPEMPPALTPAAFGVFLAAAAPPTAAPWAATCDDPARCELPVIRWATLAPVREAVAA